MLAVSAGEGFAGSLDASVDWPLQIPSGIPPANTTIDKIEKLILIGQFCWFYQRYGLVCADESHRGRSAIVVRVLKSEYFREASVAGLCQLANRRYGTD